MLGHAYHYSSHMQTMGYKLDMAYRAEVHPHVWVSSEEANLSLCPIRDLAITV